MYKIELFQNTKLKSAPSEVQQMENKLQQQEKLNETLLMRINRLKQALISTNVDLTKQSEMKKVYIIATDRVLNLPTLTCEALKLIIKVTAVFLCG